MNEVFLVFEFPKTFHVDNGTELDNKVSRKGCDELNIQFSTISTYYAQANPTECSNKVLKTTLRKFSKDNYRMYDEHIYEFAHAVNNEPHESLSTE